jgi:hypothetical protein
MSKCEREELSPWQKRLCEMGYYDPDMGYDFRISDGHALRALYLLAEGSPDFDNFEDMYAYLQLHDPDLRWPKPWGGQEHKI